MGDEKIFFDLSREVEEFELRFALLLEIAAPRRGTLAWLSDKTGLSESKWKNVLARKQRPTTEMVVALCHLRPDLTRWLVLGHTNVPDQVPSSTEIKLAQEVIEARGSRYKVKSSAEESYDGWAPGNALLLDETLRLAEEARNAAANLLNQDNR